MAKFEKQKKRIQAGTPRRDARMGKGATSNGATAPNHDPSPRRSRSAPPLSSPERDGPAKRKRRPRVGSEYEEEVSTDAEEQEVSHDVDEAAENGEPTHRGAGLEYRVFATPLAGGAERCLARKPTIGQIRKWVFGCRELLDGAYTGVWAAQVRRIEL